MTSRNGGIRGSLVVICQPKKKKAKKDVFTVNFHFDGIFTSWPLKYCQGQVRVMTDTNFDEMSYEVLKEIAKKLVPHALFEKIYYCQTGVKLTLGLREIKSTQDIAEMMKVGYESGNEIDMYVEHFGYDIMELVKLEVNQEDNHNNIEESDDEYYGSDDYEEIENVDFQTEGDESVVIKSITPLADPDDHQIHAVNKVQSGVLYPTFDPDIPWDKMEPTLGMRYETPYQLKLALANYGVAHGYQLWYMKNDWREVLVYCGRNVEEGRCAGKKGNKDRVMKNKVRSGVQRMYASWMSNEHSFQIKSLNSEHKCCRNYNLGSLVTFRTAKQLALFDHEGGLIEHYGKLYQYRQALLDSNPGSTCRLDVDESSNRQLGLVFDGNEITIISDSHKIKQIDEGAYDYLIQRNPNSWSRAFFEMDKRCAAFENGISESFNKAILDRITPSVRKRLEILKEKQREWIVFPSGFQELEVRKDDQSYDVSLQHK
ncbi:hypothetical protein Tco_0846898, partial [Tanacetum coccineum]